MTTPIPAALRDPEWVHRQRTTNARQAAADDQAAIEGDVATLQTDVVALQGDVTAAQGNIATLQDDVTTLEADVTTLQGQIATAQGDITAIQADIATAQADITTLQGQGHVFATDDVTLDAAPATTTTVNVADLLATDSVFVQPLNDAARSMEGFVHISAVVAGSFTITHASASTSRLYRWVALRGL